MTAHAWDLGEDRPDACGTVGWLREPVHCTVCAAQHEAREAHDDTLPRGTRVLVLWQTRGAVHAEVWT